MKAKTLATVIASAICTSSMAAAVATHPSSGLQQIKAAQMAELTKQTASHQPTILPENRRPGGVNRQIRPASGDDKFAHEPARSGEDVYIVRLQDLPVATYDGRVKGYAATAKSVLRSEVEQGLLVAPRGTRGLETLQQNRAVSYKNYLMDKQQSVVQEARALGVKHMPRLQFTDAINGFTMSMTQAQAKALAKLPQVAFVQRSDTLQLHTDRGPEFIGADKVWNGQTAASNLKQKGEGMIVGILDTGINTDHVSFADVGDDGYDHTNPWGSGNYVGDCATGAATCNDKLIGVWSWPFITDTYEGIRPASGEDYNGHGSHTASTAAGNVVHNVPYLGGTPGVGDGIPTGFEFEQVSGVAPHANIISYQVCFPDHRGCPSEVMLKAIDQAIQDGVDVINFSIGGGDRFPWEDATAMAFLSAREAGISIAASAGNAGKGFYTLSHTAPWYTVVAASTSDRVMEVTANSIEMSGGATNPPSFYISETDPKSDDIAGFSQGSVTGTPVLAANYGDEMCLNEFAADTFTSDQIVICKRGQNARVDKAFNVQAGGAGGFILYNDSYAGMTSEEKQVYDDIYPLPGLHIKNYPGTKLVNWVSDGGTDHRVTITGGSIARTLDESAGDMLADFSSRGPATHFTGSLAPHISAPGVDILAAYADEQPFTGGLAKDWAMISGTSMASPHVAGALTLVRQAHPDWTPAEVQSALLMTAAQTVREPIDAWHDPRPAHTYRAGAGRVDVAAAVEAGLVMDETAANFEFANPKNGGDVKQLNLPQLVDNDCRRNCSWIRTVRATRDGSWTVSNGDWTYDVWAAGEGEKPVQGARIEAFPASFSLKAGETQTIIFRADLTDAQWEWNGVYDVEDQPEIELWSEVRFKASDSSIPDAHWPVSINFDRAGLPSMVNIEVHRDNGSYHVKDLPLPAMNSIAYRGYTPVKAKVEEITLPQDNNHYAIYMDGDHSPGHTRVTLHEVPENTARLVVEVLENVSGPGWNEAKRRYLDGWATLFIGRDADGDGEVDMDTELLCASSTQIELNYCSITNPDAGSYWVMVENVRMKAADNTEYEGFELVDTYKVATAIVPANVGGLQVEGPASSDGSKAVSVDLNWALSGLEEGDVAYAGFDIGTANAPGNIGFVPVKLTRGVDDVSLTASQTQAIGGDIIDVSVHVLENNSGIDREIDLISQLPEGLTLVEGSVKINNPRMRDNLTVDGNLIRVNGVQENSGDWKPDYRITTSETDQMCRTPNYGGTSNGGFIGLFQNYGFIPEIGGLATDFVNPEFRIQLSRFWGENASINLFNNKEYRSYPALVLSPQGYAALEAQYNSAAHIAHWEFPYYSDPYTPFIGAFWKGTVNSQNWFGANVDALGTPLNQTSSKTEGSGIALAWAKDPANNINDIIIEWVNARTQNLDVGWSGGTLLSEKADRYSFNLIVHEGYRYGEGEYEFTMAYGDLDFAGEPGAGSVGLHGHYGPLDVQGYPYYYDQEIGKSFAYNNLDTKLKKDLVVCYDYVGPESTQFDLSFQVRVAETATGQDLELAFVSDIDGMAQEVKSQIIVVPSNLILTPFKDHTMDENTTLEGIEVVYLDKDQAPNLITVSGAHITAHVSGNTSGSTISITPDANWYGETQITVTVADEQVPADKASQTFTLTVVSDGEEPGCTDMNADNYDENATKDDGSCTYPQPEPEPEPQPQPEEPKKKKKKSGGSTGTLMLGLLIIIGLMRRFRITAH
ncbi:S8 family serine peptidase [Microbulbifer pacificus]|uniref:S8 family serine peptidase n=1 Tax=Microbulbifer pacificus TaxID=407164 RepID=UPI001319BBDB|nr:S8 family serine peptidase [Microbulbifer pacificus]